MRTCQFIQLSVRALTALSLAFAAGSAGLVATACSESAGSGDPASESTEEELVGLARADVVGTLAYGESLDVPSVAARRYRAVRFAGKAGDAVDIWVRSGHDARAWLVGPDFRKTLTANDDADATTKNARLTFTLKQDGEHTIAFREATSATTTFAVSLAKAGPIAGASADPCVKHPWPMEYGCRDRQGRSSSTGPTAPTIAWQTQLRSPCAIEHLVVDAAGTAYVSQDSCQDTFLHAHGGGFSAVKADGTIAWSTSLLGRLRDLVIGGDDALYGYVMGLRPVAAWSSVVVHSFYRFDPATGAGTKLFSEEIGSDRLPRVVTPLPDGRVSFSVPTDIAEADTPSLSPSAKIYDPVTKSLSDAPSTVSTPWQRASLPDGSTLSSRTDYDYAKSVRQFWVERRDAAGALLWRADDAQLWGVAPGGTVFGTLAKDFAYGRPAILGLNGAVTAIGPAKTTRLSPYTLAIGADDSLVVGVYDSWVSPSSFIAKYTKTGALVFTAPVPVEGGNIAIDAQGNIYGGGVAFGPTGVRLEAPGRPWVPALDRVALGPNKTLYTAWSRPSASGTLYKLADAAP